MQPIIKYYYRHDSPRDLIYRLNTIDGLTSIDYTESIANKDYSNTKWSQSLDFKDKREFYNYVRFKGGIKLIPEEESCFLF